MKRSPLKLGKGFQPRTGAIARKLSAPVLKPGRKAGLKSKGPRMTPIRHAAAGQDCTLRIPGACNWNLETTVLCHSNELADGKGMGIKAPDTAAAFGCSACHDVLDGRRPRPAGVSLLDVAGAFYVGMRATHVILRRMGLMP